MICTMMLQVLEKNNGVQCMISRMMSRDVEEVMVKNWGPDRQDEKDRVPQREFCQTFPRATVIYSDEAPRVIDEAKKTYI